MSSHGRLSGFRGRPLARVHTVTLVVQSEDEQARFSAEESYTVCGRANQRRFAVAEWFQPTRRAEAVMKAQIVTQILLWVLGVAAGTEAGSRTPKILCGSN